MSVLRQYQEYNAIHLTHYSLDWAGETYDTLLVKSGSIALSEFLEGDLSKDVLSLSFIYPSSYANKYYLDGTAEGYISIFNASTVTDDTGDVGSYTVKLEATTDTAPTPTEIFNTTRVLSSNNSVVTNSYLSLPIYVPINEKLVEADQKLIFTIEYTQDGAGGDLQIACSYSTTGGVDNVIRIPYAPSG